MLDRRLVVVLLSVVSLSFMCVQYWGELQEKNPGFVHLSEDENVVRFSRYCVASLEGDEGEMPQPGDLRLSRVVVLHAHGDSTPALDWPGEDSDGVAWDCHPHLLPRHWRLNSDTRFEVVGPDGTALDRSYDPDLESVGGVTSYACSRGQLTPSGFQQMILAGRHLSFAFEQLLVQAVAQGSGRLEVHSADLQRSTASVVGLLMSLLASADVRQLLAETPVHIHVQPNGSLDALQPHFQLLSHRYSSDFLFGRAQEVTSATNMVLGEQLLARWCHDLPLPCKGDGTCLSVEKAAEIIRGEEQSICQHLASRLAINEVRAIVGAVSEQLRRSDLALSLLGSSGVGLTAVVNALLGEVVCVDPMFARPPLASRLVFERWESSSKARWRVLFNGEDVTSQVPQCDGMCEETALLARLEAESVL